MSSLCLLFCLLLPFLRANGLRALRATGNPPRLPRPLYDEGTRALDEGLPPRRRVQAARLSASQPRPRAPARRRAPARARVARPARRPRRARAARRGNPLPAAARRTPKPPSGAARPTPRSAIGPTLWPITPAPPSPSPARRRPRRARPFRPGRSPPRPGRAAEAAAAFSRLRDHPLLGEPARLRFAEIALDRWPSNPTAPISRKPPPRCSTPDRRRRLPADLPSCRRKERAYLLGRLRLAQRQPALRRADFHGCARRTPRA